jgi:hypothetical protein
MPLRCDDVSHPGCPTGMTCNPALMLDASMSRPEGGYSLTGTDQLPPGAPPELTARQSEAARAGCVFLRCDESGAFDCAEDHRCDPMNAEPITTGCVGIPCQQLGRCSSSEFVCEPEDTRARSAIKDPHGCVQANCEEGHVCPSFSRCNFDSPGDGRGCGYLRCDEPGGGCAAGKTCQPEPGALPTDVNGCVPIAMNGASGGGGAAGANGGATGGGGGGSETAAGSAGSETATGTGGANTGPVFGVCRD